MFTAPWKMRAGLAVALVLSAVFIPMAGAQDGTGGGVSTPGTIMMSGAATVNPPVIISLQATQVAGKKFKISGRVADDTPASCSVTITGAATGTAQCDSAGNFSTTLDVPNLGEITAVASDGQLSSAAAGLTLTNAAPAITVRAIRRLNTWTFSGFVTDEAAAGLTVTLSGGAGVNGLSATVAADGSWSVSVTGLLGAGGTATATVTDWYGQTASASTPYGS
jgi:hypothetical protein